LDVKGGAVRAAGYLLTFGVVFTSVLDLKSDWRTSGPTLPPAHAAEETPAETLAIQIRKQGYPCEKPVSAERDAERSKPDEAVWVLKCGNARYRMRLIPDMAAKVERLE
jgi:hypothetical protein